MDPNGNVAGAAAIQLDADPKAPATVVLRHLRKDGYAGGITILKQHLANVRPQFVAARSFQRTSYLPGEISQIDWWHTGRQIPVGKGATREAFGLVATLPASAAHAAVFTFGRTVADLIPAALRCFERLGGVPDKVVCDNDAAIVRERRGEIATLRDEVASFFGQLGAKVVPLRPGDPQAKGQVERTNGYLDGSFLSRALKAPRIREVAPTLAEWAREEAWGYEDYLAAVLPEEVASREDHGGANRVKAARFPQIKILDDFDFSSTSRGFPPRKSTSKIHHSAGRSYETGCQVKRSGRSGGV